MVPIDELASNPANPTARVENDEDLQQLAASIAHFGVAMPILVASADEWLQEHPEDSDQVGGRPWVVLAGHRRVAAARVAGLTRIPYYQRPADRGDEAILHENIHRKSLTDFEQAVAYRRLVDKGMSQREVAKAIGIHESQVSRRLSLLDFPPLLQQAIDRGRLTSYNLRELKAFEPDMRVLHAAAQAWDGTCMATLMAEVRDRQVEERRLAAVREAHELLDRDYPDAILLDRPERPHKVGHTNRLLNTRNEIRAAERAGTLALGPSPDHSSVAYYAVEPTHPLFAEEPAAATASPSTSDTPGCEGAERKAAAQGRRAALDLVARAQPRPADLRHLLVELEIYAVPAISARSARVAQSMATAAGLDVATRDNPTTWIGRLPQTDPGTARDHLAWVLALARLETRALDTKRDWDNLDRFYLHLLAERAGYVPTPWESDRLDNVGRPSADDD